METKFVRTPESRFGNLQNFPYSPHYIDIGLSPNNNESLRLAYIDEKTSSYIDGKSRTFLCLHGVPTYSYLYRNILPVLLKSDKSHNNGVRVICPDLIGFGRSDKPTNKYSNIHSLKFHRNSIIQLINKLNLKNITLIVQDWGGLIGLTLPMYFNSNPNISDMIINRIIMFNTFICDGTNISKGFINWRTYSTNPKTRLNPGKIVSSSCRDKTKENIKYHGLKKEEINAYNAPFINETYKTALRVFPSMVAITPNDNGMDIWRETWFFYENNRNKSQNDQTKINIFMANGQRDVVFNHHIAHKLFNKLISDKYDPSFGTTMEIGGVLWVPDGSHFMQESRDIEWVINRALKYFGDISYDPVEYEWILSADNVRIIKIILNYKKVHPLTPNVINCLNNIFDYADNNEYCRGIILTAYNKPRILLNKRSIYSAGLDLKTMKKNDAKLAKEYILSVRNLWIKHHSFSKPVISAVNGDAIAGGALLALAGDYRIGYRNTKIHMLEAQIGLGASISVVAQIERVVGSKDMAGYLLQTALPFSGSKALKYNLLNEIVDDEDINNGSYDKNLMIKSVNVLENEYFNAQLLASANAKRGCRQYVIDIIHKEISNGITPKGNNNFLSSNVQKYIQNTIKSKL